MTYEEDYSYHLFMHGDVFNNILSTFVQFHGKPNFTIPRRYKEITEQTHFFYLRWAEHLHNITQTRTESMSNLALELYNEELQHIQDLKRQERAGVYEPWYVAQQTKAIQKRIDKLLKKA